MVSLMDVRIIGVYFFLFSEGENAFNRLALHHRRMYFARLYARVQSGIFESAFHFGIHADSSSAQANPFSRSCFWWTLRHPTSCLKSLRRGRDLPAVVHYPFLRRFSIVCLQQLSRLFFGLSRAPFYQLNVNERRVGVPRQGYPQ